LLSSLWRSSARGVCVRLHPRLVVAEGPAELDEVGQLAAVRFEHAGRVQESLSGFGVALTDEQAACGTEAYAESGQPLYFALGIGVAAGENPNASAGGVLAHNPNTSVLSNGNGIDHFEDSGISRALEDAAATCGIPVES
jgi:hypothetical protein